MNHFQDAPSREPGGKLRSGEDIYIDEREDEDEDMQITREDLENVANLFMYAKQLDKQNDTKTTG